MGEPIQWGRAQLSWAPDGYHLTIELWLDERASALFDARVGEALAEFDELGADPVYRFEGGRRWHNASGAGAEQARLTVIAPRTLFAIEPGRLQDTLGRLATKCELEADEQHGRDQEIAEDWLARLRGRAK